MTFPRRWPTLAFLAVTLFLGCRLPVQPALPAKVDSGRGDLTVTVVGFRNDLGMAMVSLFGTAEGFPGDVARSRDTRTVPVTGQRAHAVFRDLPYGPYAVSVLHDENGDGRMAATWLGMPREGFGFSGHPTYRRGRPDFDDVAVLLAAPARSITVRLRYETVRRERREKSRAKAIHPSTTQ